MKLCHLSCTVRVRQAMGEMEKILFFNFFILDESLVSTYHSEPKSFDENCFVWKLLRKNHSDQCTIAKQGKK